MSVLVSDVRRWEKKQFSRAKFYSIFTIFKVKFIGLYVLDN